eukprot:CCRYP_014626-RA/>CCRYP_014626-RA protein AED:0.39 eAED:0.39 QI:0/0/0/1/0/0/2/0/256
MLTTKVLLNSVISTKGARFMTIDIRDFYLNTPMVRPKYMRLEVSDIPDHIIALYNLNKLATTDGYLYVLIQKGKYGLPPAGIIAQQLLENTITPDFWKHDWRPISFTLCVDNFGVKYVGIKHAHHLIQKLNKHYKTSQDWKGEGYLVSQSHETIPSDRYIFPCQATVKMLATISTILFLPNHNINLILIHPAPMEPNNNLSKLKTTLHYSPNPTRLCPRSHWGLPLLCACSACTRLTCHSTIGSNAEYLVENTTVP